MAIYKRTPRRRPEFEEDYMFGRLETLTGFDRIAYHYSQLLSVTGSATIKAITPPKRRTTIDEIMEYLEKIKAVDFETGKSTAQIAKALNVKQITVQKVMPELVERGLVKQERKGRRIKYYLPKP